MSLSGGQQQRLCIARSVAVRPEVILFDEPSSALDPISTAKIEELISELEKSYTIVIVTHNMQQAVRVSDYTAFMYLGELIEFGPTATLFTTPRDKRTQAYITGLHALRRVARPQELARSVLYLASDDAASVTGANLVVDGGFVKSRLEKMMKEKNRVLVIEGTPVVRLFPVAGISLGRTTLSEPGGASQFVALEKLENFILRSGKAW